MRIDLKKIQSKIKLIFKKLQRFLVEKFLLVLLFFLILDLILAFYLFKTSTSFKEERTSKIPTFRKDLYQKVIEEWKEREEIFNKIEEKRYLNPFQEK
jgi:predicted neutral ceramidase superfamily lipid hydrolase